MAVTLVAMSRSSVSASVVYRSRGKPENADRVVFMTMRSSMPASTTVASRPTATGATRVPPPPRPNASPPHPRVDARTRRRAAAGAGRAPRVRADVDGRALDLLVLEEVAAEHGREILDRAGQGVGCEGIRGVLSRVGRGDGGVG